MSSKKIWITLLFLIVGCSCYTQQKYDEVYKTDKTLVQGSIIKVTKDHLEIDPKGSKPFLLIPINAVEVVVYRDNSVFRPSRDGNSDKTGYDKNRTITGKTSYEAKYGDDLRVWYEIDDTKNVLLNSDQYTLEMDFSLRYHYSSISFSHDYIVKMRKCKLNLDLVDNETNRKYEGSVDFDRYFKLKFDRNEEKNLIREETIVFDDGIELTVAMLFMNSTYSRSKDQFLFDYKLKEL